MQTLPAPEVGGSLDDLRRLLNLDDGDQFQLIVAFLCGAMMPGQPVPLLVANGEQGSGKSTVSKVVKQLLDPSAAPVRCEPKEVRDLMIAAGGNHVLALDNLSGLSVWLSDALCRMATGGGFATRALYTNDDEVIFDARRPMILNGIEDFVCRGDLLDRSILLRLPSIPAEKRVPESMFWGRFETVRPTLLGALLTRVAGGLRELPSVRLDHFPRMADFARWCVACERGAGEPERFLALYIANQSGAHEQALDWSAVAGAVVSLMTGRDEWEGTCSELLMALAIHAPSPLPRDWPTAANALSGRLRRLAPHLRLIHRIHFDTDRATDSSRRRLVRLWRQSSGPSERPSAPPATSTRPGFEDILLDDPRATRPSSSSFECSTAALSDSSDGLNDHSARVQPVTAAAFAGFLDLH